jgi:ATP-dependent DNA helicase HFM1/MER3
MKALVQEKLRDWNMKLGSLGISCLEMTGDNEFYNTKSIHDADLILTTPEVYVTACFALHGVKRGLAQLLATSLFFNQHLYVCRSLIL